MNIVNKLTLRHLKENKGRSIVTSLGIIVSVAMITAVFVALASFMNLFGDIAKISYGDCSAKLFGMNAQQVDELKKNDKIDLVGVQVDYYKKFQLDERVNDRKGTGDILASTVENSKMYIQAKYDGKIPENENEIAVEKSFIEDNNLDWKIGDTVTIPYGERTVIENGDKIILSGSYYDGEKFEKQGEQQYKITAVIYGNSPTVGYSIICGLTDYQGYDITTSFRLKNISFKALEDVDEIYKSCGASDIDINSELLDAHFAYEKGGLIEQMLPLVAIVLAIIIIASVVLIYNAFAMSLAEKVKYLGMLSSVGATKKQKQLSIYFEGLILGLISLPVGIGAGVLGIGITLKLLGEKIISTSMIMGINDSNVSMKVIVPLWAIIGIIVISLFTILLSCAIPAKKASKITPIMALRQSNEIKVKAKKLRSPKIIKAVFGYEGELAHKNLKRNGRKSRVITVSIALSVILFLSCNYFCNLFVRASDMDTSPYQVVVYSGDYEHNDKIKNEIKKLKDVDDVYCASNTLITLNDVDNADEGLKEFYNRDNLTNTYGKLFDSKNYLFINFIDDDMFNELCENNDIDYNKYYDGECKALLMNNISHSSSSASVFNDNALNTRIEDVASDLATPITITDFVKYDSKTKACNLNSQGSVSLYVPFSVYHSKCDSLIYCIAVETNNHEQVYEEIIEIVDRETGRSNNVVDIAEQLQAMNTIVLVMQVFIYGFISLISLITVFNIINTITTGIASRRKEFAMLKSVGTTPKGFNKMVMLESAFYGIKSLIFAIPISLLISLGMNMVIGENSIPFEFDFVTYLSVIAVVFAIICLTMLYSVKQVQKENIIDNLKDDIN